jgi:probable F420-dependent oxidoreductase
MITGTGVWSAELRFHKDQGELADAAAELESLGYSLLWFPGLGGGDVFGTARTLLDATESVPVASGILNIWGHDPQEVVDAMPSMDERFILGLGAGHPEATSDYKRPLTAVRNFLDAIDQPSDRMCLAALRSKMLDLAAERTLGAHPYFVPVEHTAAARERLGDGVWLAPECAVVLERDPDKARALARGHMALYLTLTNYVTNLREYGFTDADIADGGSDRLVDAIVAWGDEDAIASRLDAHREAGADHVCWQVIHDGGGLPREQWRRLSELSAR